MTSSGCAGRVERVDQLVGLHADNRQREAGRRHLHLFGDDDGRRIGRLYGDDRTAARDPWRGTRHRPVEPNPEEAGEGGGQQGRANDLEHRCRNSPPWPSLSCNDGARDCIHRHAIEDARTLKSMVGQIAR